MNASRCNIEQVSGATCDLEIRGLIHTKVTWGRDVVGLFYFMNVKGQQAL